MKILECGGLPPLYHTEACFGLYDAGRAPLSKAQASLRSPYGDYEN